MKKIIFSIALVLVIKGIFAQGGMWIPSLIGKYNIEDMKKAGFKLTAEDVYDINKACLKDAILGISNKSNATAFTGSASLISKDGLVITNQHNLIKYISRLKKKNNYIEEGFWAKNKNQEVYLKGLVLSRLVRIENVTKALYKGIDKNTPANKINKIINSNGKNLAKLATYGTHYKAKIKSYFSGNQFFMEVYEHYNDVRLVGLPQKDLAKFGGDKDNWTYPRQSADFGLLRIYANNENISAKYAKANKAYQSKNFLKPTSQEIGESDFAMIMGFPGSSKQYVTSEAIDQYLNINNKSRLKISDAFIAIYSKLKPNTKAYNYYLSTVSSLKNSALRRKAENKAFVKYDLISKKIAEENTIIAKFPKTKAFIDTINNTVKQLKELELANEYLVYTGLNGAEIIPFLGKFEKLHLMGTKYKANDKKNTREIKRLRPFVEKFFKNFYPKVQQQILAKGLELYYTNVPKKYHSKALTKIANEYKGNFQKYAKKAFKKSMFTSKKRITKFLDNYKNEDAHLIVEDPLFDVALGYYITNAEKVAMKRVTLRRKYGSYFKQLVLYKTKSGIKFGPDANRSLRVSFGQVKSTSTNKFFTNVGSLLDKINTKDAAYKVDKQTLSFLKTLNKDDKVCFIVNTQTTGGNSGSTVLNAKGEIMGVYFDRNKEGVIADYGFISPDGRGVAVSFDFILSIIKHYNQEIYKEIKK